MWGVAMKGKDSKEQLMEELNHLRKRVAELESADAKRKQAEEEVHSKEQLFRALIDHSSDIIVLVNREGTIIYENPAIEQAIGLKPEERLGASVFERIHLDDVKIVTDAFSKLWQDPDTAAQKAEIRLRHKDGKWRTFEATGTNLVRDSAIEAVIVNLRDITNRKQVEQKLRASEERFRALIESSLDVVTIVDAKGTVLFQSPNYTSLWGRDPSGEVGKDMFKDVHPDDIPLVGDAFVRLLKNPKEPVQLQVRALHTDGTWRNLDVVAHNHLENPAVRGIVVTFRDITERKRAEEEFKENEARLRAFIDNAPDLIVIYDLDGNVVDGNRKGGELTGYRRSEIVGKNFIESGMVPEEYIRKAQKGLEKNRKGEPAGPDEYELIARDGRRIPVEITSFPVARAGKVEVIGIARDITERKKAEEDLRKSEENFRRSLDDSPLGIRIVTVDGETLYANQAMLDIYGYDSIEELKTTSPKERYTPESYAEHQVRKEKRQRGEYAPPNYEISIMRKNGEIRHLEVFRKEVLWNGETQFQVLYNDITERKKAYEALKKSEEYFKEIIENSSDIIVITDKNGDITYCSHSIESFTGYKPEELIGKSGFVLTHPDDVQRAVSDFGKAILRKDAVASNAFRIVHKDGTERHFDGLGRNLLNNPSVAGLIFNIRDITERKRMEQELHDSEEMSRGMLESAATAICIIKDGKFDYMNPMFAEMTGYTVDELMGTVSTSYIHEDDRDSVMREAVANLKGESIAPHEYRLLRKDGSFIWILEKIASIQYKGERAAIGSLLDITRLKQVENALKMSEEKLRGIFDSIQDAVVLTDLDFIILDVNDAALELSGCKTKEEVIGIRGYDLIAPEDFARAMATQPEAVEGRPVPRAEYKIINKLGKEICAEVGVSMYQDPSGKTAGFVTVLKDITEHKRMENALRDSEEKLRIMFSSMADGVVVTDLEGKITDLNEAQLRMFGYKEKKEIIGKGGFDFIVERDRERAFKEVVKVFEEGYNIGATYGVVDNKGKEFESELSTALLHDAAGKPAGLITVMRDVTERRRMEQALRDSEEKLRVIFESIGDGIVVTDLEGIITETNEAAAKLGGWSDKSKLIGMSGFDFVAEKEQSKLVTDMIRALKEQKNINVEYSVKDKDGREYQSEVNITLLRDASGSPRGIVSVIRDITERKRMEQELRDSEEMSRGMLESAATAVCVVKDGEFQYVSPMFAEMTGYTVDELIGTVSASYIHDDDRDRVMREAVANLKGESITPHEYRLLRKDGSFIWILEKIASIQYKGERAAIGSLLDITRLKQVEEELRDSEEKLRLIFSSMPDGVTVTDVNGKIMEENDAGIKLSGFTSKDQVIGLNGFDFIASSDRSRALADLPKIFKTGVRGPLEYRMVSNDGREYDGEIIAAMIRDKSRNPQGFITVIRDVTERKKAREELQESQEMTRGMLESAATGIYLVQDGKFEYVNPLFSGISGYVSEELLGSDSMNYIHPDDREVARIKVIENLKGINDLPHEFRFMRKDGQSTWILEKVASIEYKGRRAAIGSFMDISERKRIEEVLRQRSHELEQRTNQLLALQKITASIQSTLDLKEILQQVANGVVHNLGFDHALILKVDEAANVARGTVFATRDDVSKVSEVQATIRKRLTEIEVPQVRGYSKVVDNSLDGKATIMHDFFEVASTILTQDESNAVAELLDVKTVIVMPLFARDRHVGSILALTKQEEIGGILLEPLRILSDQAGFAIENADLYRGVSEFAQRLSVISALSKILGSSLDIKGVYRAFTEEIKKVMDFDRTSIAMVEGDQLRYFVVAEEVDTELKDGATLPLSDSATGVVVKTKKTIIEPDFDKEMKFPIDHMYYRSGLRSAIRVPLFSKGEVFATFNLASRRPNAYGEREKEILEQVSGSLTASIENSRLFDQVKQHEDELLKAYEDLKLAQEYMVQSEKLKALGEMAGGVAHDFNNILAVVLGRTQLALEDVKDEKLKKDLQIIEQTAIDAVTTVRRLQDFARVRVERNFEVLDLKEVIESALQMAESRLVKLKEREGINIDVESKLRELAPVEGDVAELREGLLNIIFNAMDAMPKGGKITIEAKQTNKWATVSISDTGIGMPKEIMDRIFEPFFTTRMHKGTGLGLSVTYGIIQRHRGEISVESTVGVGSTFYIKLPVCERVVSKKHAAGKADAVKGVSILMVDDNPEVAGILGLTLRRLGHTVVEANSGEAAISTFEMGNFDLVITDLGMPDMSGHEVAKIVKEMKPGTPVLVISGWGGQLNLEEMPEVDGVIAKPFSKDVLSEKIAALLSCEGTQARDLKQKAAKTKKSSKGVSKSDKAAEGLTGKEEKPKKRKGTDKKE